MTAGWETVPPGIRLCLSAEPLRTAGAGLFLDRDGVIVRDPGYLRRAEDVRLIDGAAELIRTANGAGIPVLVATNQSGIARGLFGWEGFEAVQAEISAQLAASGARLDGVAACPFHPDFTPDYGPEQAQYRKPAPGMIDLLAKRLNIDKAASWMVGDRSRDIKAARAAGLAGGILVYGNSSEQPTDPPPDAGGFSVLWCLTVSDAHGALLDRLFRK